MMTNIMSGRIIKD